ncbi:MerR family transcriptional regulator [Streptomyces sp. NBC_01218]|uniref:MerR family transcriptional regulator n=1 Tax=unclassified Streptomyces TaxID=2593676 RepID=UPI0023B9F6B4|nr:MULTISPECIES: MerR family transcriptional regulator [unclassified Streptomyces]WEH38095.1 MerR family transcriptional regulator [Streptomyces sp. AM 2-1-1]WSQ49751.1 MerR family transcriptional regulator [Streptomyces sp. NBC_01218]WSQ55090.1 MerR family transcriptional regulator [Streptomyces sp. NBC_01218]
MRIGELSERTATPRRMLRYYEEQGLLVPSRASNGYRDYAPGCVDRVLQIRGLLESGLPTRVIKQVLPCIDDPAAIHISGATPETIATLERERDSMAHRLQCLLRSHEAIVGYLEAVRRDQQPRTQVPAIRYGRADAVTEAA